MFINKLGLHNFRCFENIEIVFEERLTVIVGDNGSGKTAMLEGGFFAACIFLSSFEEKEFKYYISARDARLKTYIYGDEIEGNSQYPVIISANSDITQGREFKLLFHVYEGQKRIKIDESIINISRHYQNCMKNGDCVTLPLIAYYGADRCWNSQGDVELKTLSYDRIQGHQ